MIMSVEILKMSTKGKKFAQAFMNLEPSHIVGTRGLLLTMKKMKIIPHQLLKEEP